MHHSRGGGSCSHPLGPAPGAAELAENGTVSGRGQTESKWTHNITIELQTVMVLWKDRME